MLGTLGTTMRYEPETNCVNFTHDEYNYLFSLSQIVKFTPTKEAFQIFNNSRGYMHSTCLWNLADPAYAQGGLRVANTFLYENFRMIKLAHAAMDNANIKFMHDLLEALFPNAQY